MKSISACECMYVYIYMHIYFFCRHGATFCSCGEEKMLVSFGNPFQVLVVNTQHQHLEMY